jgi:hypothetical protein
MFKSDWREELPAKVRVLQIIIVALFFGCCSFLIISIIAGNNNNAIAQPMLIYIALAFIATMVVPWIVLPGIIVAQGRKKIRSEGWAAGPSAAADVGEIQNRKAGALFMLYQTKTIIRGAMLEGPAMFLIVINIIQRSPIALIIAGLLMVLLLGLMPTAGRVTIWIEDQLKLLDEERRIN